MGSAVTRADVARAAGVSVASVTRALNNSGYVKKDVREKIIAIADELGYSPNPIALSLIKLKTRQLILYQNEITAPYNISFFNGATRAAYKRGYAIFLDVHCDYDKIKRHLVDGVMFSLDVLAERYLNDGGANYILPVVVATNDANFAFPRPVHSIVIDNPQIINMAIDYLMSQGHERIGFVTSERGRHSDIRIKLWRTRLEKEARRLGKKFDFSSLIIRAEIGDTDDVLVKHPDPPLITQPSDDNFANYSSFKIGQRAARRYLESKNPATAFLCFNDDIAYGFMREIEKEGIRVPQDISVMGIDGIYLRDWFEKRVTTVSIDAENIGNMAANVLIDVLEGKKPKYMNWTKPFILEGDTVRKI